MKTSKDDLAKLVQQNLKEELTLQDIKICCDETFAAITDALINGNKVEIRNFGSFSLRSRKVPEDPRKIAAQGEAKNRKECKSIYFRATKNLMKKV